MPSKRVLVAAGVAALVIAAVAALVGSTLISSSEPSSKSSDKKPKSRGFVRFRDREAGFAISYPRKWRRLPSEDAQVRLIVAGGRASLLVRAAPLGLRVRPANIDRAKRLTDRLVRSVEKVKLLRKAKRVQLGGLPGYLYLYTFRDKGTRELGAHAHYFVFRGEVMYTLIFQALPSTTFAGFAPLFDRISNTFRVLGSTQP